MRTTKVSGNAAGHELVPAISWKHALGSVLGAASRLHHYRDIHTRMMRDAMCVVDCGGKKDECGDE